MPENSSERYTAEEALLAQTVATEHDKIGFSERAKPVSYDEGEKAVIRRRHDVVLERSLGESEELPELELRLLLRSKDQVNREGGMELHIESVISWNNYTIVMLDRGSDIHILDESAEPLDDFKSPKSSTKVSVNFNELRRTLDLKSTLTRGSSRGGPYEQSISKLPLQLQALARIAMGKDNYLYIENSNMPATSDVVGQAIVLNDTYVVFKSTRGVSVTFQTKSDVGILLAPKDWVRLDPDQPYSAELTEMLRPVLESPEGFIPISDKWYAIVTDVSISIVSATEQDARPIFTDTVPSIDRNTCVDPSNANTIFYCQGTNPRGIRRVDMSGDPQQWLSVEVELPTKYDSVKNLQLDPSGNFFLFYSKEDLVILAKDTLEEVKRVPKLSHVNFDGQGRIRAVDQDNHLVIYEPNFAELAESLDRQRVAKLAAGLDIADLFGRAAKKKGTKEDVPSLERLQPLRDKFEGQFRTIIDTITTAEGVSQLRQGYNTFREALRQQGLKTDEIGFIVAGLEEPLVTKEREFAAKGAEDIITAIRAKLVSGLSLGSASEARDLMARLRVSEGLLEPAKRQEVTAVAEELEQKSLELFRVRGGEVIKDVQGIVSRIRADLEGFTSKAQMDDWSEFRYPQLKLKLGMLARDIPIEADEAYKAVTQARTELTELAGEYQEKFKLEYAKVREKATSRLEKVVETMVDDVKGLVDRLVAKRFSSREEAEQYLASSEARRSLEEEISALTTSSPEAAKELHRTLRIRLSNALTDIERGTLTTISESGQQMVTFGRVAFPKWEAKVKEHGERRADLVFSEDKHSRGPGVKAGDIQGDVSLKIRASGGHTETVGLYDDWADEDDWRLGTMTYRGQDIPPSYVSAADYKAVKKDYTDWSQGETSELKLQYAAKKQALQELYARRQKIGQRTTEVDEAWQQEYQTALNEYAAFVAEHNIVLLRRIDRIKSLPEIEYSNGQGLVPEWQNHWVMDPKTEQDLETFARSLNMQLELQEGMHGLKGHAGSGKDVLVKMFCALTNRPYFGFDCTKWTTEFELSEDVVLEAADGASYTMKVPSKILTGIQTPGAIVYFNEFSAMPEQAQIFLHSLMDEKRSITLKTSSGQTVKAHPSVAIVGSWNPGYPGTFDIQFATRSRIVSQEIDYPPLTRKPEAGDKNPNMRFDVSEALRMARGVDSLADLTEEASIERNGFVKMWDHYVNGLENGAPDPNSTQKYDIDTILALVQFTGKLREDFIKIFEKSRDARSALPVTQPITGRELRRCAYELSHLSPTEKASVNAEEMARRLLEGFYLTHIDKREDRDKIRTAMKNWTSQKRVRT